MKQEAKKDLWFIPAEVAQGTVFVMSPMVESFFRDWPKMGFGDKIKSCVLYYKTDLGLMYYKRSEFNAEANFLAKKMVKNPKWALGWIDNIEKWSTLFMREAGKFSRLDYSKMNNEELLCAWNKVFQWHKSSHGAGVAVSWHADADEERVTKAITAVVEKKIKFMKLDLNVTDTFNILSTPKVDSFGQLEEKGLLRVGQAIFKNSKALKILKEDKNAKRLEKEVPEIFALMTGHFEKWNWLQYGYKGPAYKFNYFFERWREITRSGETPSDLLKKIINAKKKIEAERKKILQKAKFSAQELLLFELAQRMIFIKDYRKGALYFGMYSYEKFFRHLAKKYKLELKHVQAMVHLEILKLLEDGKFPKKSELEARTKDALIFAGKNHYTVLSGKKAQDFVKKLPKEKVIVENVTELRGTIASSGYAKGSAKIIEVVKDMVKMKVGDILISETTYPSLVPAMKKAAAIVTNAGGLTCHAAIVARELGIPCIVGTKIANKVIKDGDLVEVDANKGIVRILSK